MRRTGLGDAALLPLLQEQAVVAHINITLATVNFQRAINHSVEKVTVMSNHEQSALALHQLLLQPSNSGIVHVVSGLVQNQQVAGTHQNASQGHALALAAAELAHFLLQTGNAQLRQHGLSLAFQLPRELRIHLLLQLQQLLLRLLIIGACCSSLNGHFILTQQHHQRRIAAENLLQNSGLRVVGRVLGQVFHHHIARNGQLALFASVMIGNHAQQGTLTGAIDTDNAILVPFLHIKGHIFKQRPRAVAIC